MNILEELARLVVPVACPGCGLRDERLCEACAVWLRGPLRRVEAQVPRLDDLSGRPSLPVWALGSYEGPARGMVVAYKDKGREDLAKVFAAALRTAITSPSGRELLGAKVGAVVPMPSSRKAQRERGRSHLTPLAAQVAKELGAKPIHLLRKDTGRDQVGLGARARGSAQVSVRNSIHRVPARTPVLLFDDIVTTGATLAAARVALTKAGFQVAGALVLVATPPRSAQALQGGLPKPPASS
ncbi:MAG: ComF family protein [Cellulomonadaceae bacterium]|nr:ComF family protein [Cellulomonadaceae bacterium]